MIRDVDFDQSGEIEFSEFLHMLAKFKKGDSKFGAFGKLVARMNATPLAALNGEARKRKLALKYVLREVREATSMHVKAFVMEVHLTGTWSEMVDGAVRKATETRKYDGIGKSTREAKFAAATAALSKLKEHIPGIDYEVGVIPPKWLDWFEDNVERGCDVRQLLEILVAKGFYPAKNLLLMQKLSLRVSMSDLNKATPGLWPSNGGKDVPAEWLQWAEENMQRGVDGSVVLSILVENGFVPSKNPILVQLLQKNRGGPSRSSAEQHPIDNNNESACVATAASYGLDAQMLTASLRVVCDILTGACVDPIRPKWSDFWDAAKAGELAEVQRYVSGGQAPDEVKQIAGAPYTALMLATMHGHARVVKFLVLSGADPNRRDRYGRTVLHYTCAGGSRVIAEFLARPPRSFRRNRLIRRKLLAKGSGLLTRLASSCVVRRFHPFVCFVCLWHRSRAASTCTSATATAKPRCTSRRATARSARSAFCSSTRRSATAGSCRARTWSCPSSGPSRSRRRARTFSSA